MENLPPYSKKNIILRWRILCYVSFPQVDVPTIPSVSFCSSEYIATIAKSEATAATPAFSGVGCYLRFLAFSRSQALQKLQEMHDGYLTADILTFHVSMSASASGKKWHHGLAKPLTLTENWCDFGPTKKKLSIINVSTKKATFPGLVDSCCWLMFFCF